MIMKLKPSDIRRGKLFPTLDSVLYPINTEKTTSLMPEGWHSFAVAPILSKPAIKYFIEKLLAVNVISVNTSIPMPKNCIKRNYLGKKSIYKKAIVKFAPTQSLDSLAGV